MKTRILTAAVASLLAVSTIGAQSDDHAIGMEIKAVNVIMVHGMPNLEIDVSSVANEGTLSVTDNSVTYDVITNGTNMKIQAALNAAMPDNVILKVQLDATGVGTSVGQIALSTTPQDVVTGISQKSASGLMVTYELVVNLTAGEVPQFYRTIEYTIVAGG